MAALSASRSSSNIARMRQVFESRETGGPAGGLQRCRSEVVVSRGFKPSDTRDPHKTRILQDLTRRIWGRNLEASGNVGLPNGAPKPIDLQKLFTPASDAIEILPRNRKLFTSSSFYASDHPTMEEQVELARRISSSLSDISNKESKGQSMYVNRKKRSVKWVHQGESNEHSAQEYTEISSENLPPIKESKPPLKLLMNPLGKMQDMSSIRGPNYDATPSPEVCFDLVKDLNSPCGKGAELFAKRRKRAEKWVVEESSCRSETSSHEARSGIQVQPGLPKQPLGPLANLPTPTYLKDISPRFSPSAKTNQIPERFTQPKLRLIKSPWEAALEGSVDKAFQEVRQSPTPRGHVMVAPSSTTLAKLATPPPAPTPTTADELYKARPPRAWHPQPTCKTFSGEKLIEPELNYEMSNGPESLQTSSIHVDMTNVNNFNTAPRGWKSNMSYYRPVTFTAPQFTDF